MKNVIIFFVLIFLCSGVLAVSGVVPRSYKLNFKPNLNKTFNFKFVLGDVSSNLRISGDLAKYVKLNKKKISGTENVIAKLSLPSEISTPGTHQISIIADGVVAAIKINVPYPNRFIRLELGVPNVNAGQNVKINLKMINLGKQVVNVNSSIKIYKDGKMLKYFKGQSGEIKIDSSLNFNTILDTSNYSAGNYYVVASVNYDNYSRNITSQFHLGELSVKILNYTDEISENSVVKFKIDVKSLYNNNIEKLYAEVRVVDAKNIGFDTSQVKLDAWENKTIEGFFNTKRISGKSVLANITLHYDGKTSSETVKLKIIKKPNYIFYAIAILFLLGLIFLGRVIIKRLKI